MVEVIEVREVLGIKGGGPGASGNVEVNSLSDLQKLATSYNEPIILKKGKEYYLFHDKVVYRFKE